MYLELEKGIEAVDPSDLVLASLSKRCDICMYTKEHPSPYI